MENKKQLLNLNFLRILATIIVLMAMILPYFGVINHSAAPFVILVTLFACWVIESKDNKTTRSN